MRVAGRARLIAVDDINTDQIHLAMYSHLPIKEQALHCLETVRPGFAASVEPNDILIAGRNFGCGSARPAQLDLLELGIGAVIAESLDRKFFGNAVSSGLPAVATGTRWASLQEGDAIVVDTRAGMIENLTRQTSIRFSPLPEFLSRMLELGGEFPYLAAEAGLHLEASRD